MNRVASGWPGLDGVFSIVTIPTSRLTGIHAATCSAIVDGTEDKILKLEAISVINSRIPVGPAPKVASIKGRQAFFDHLRQPKLKNYGVILYMDGDNPSNRQAIRAGAWTF